MRARRSYIFQIDRPDIRTINSQLRARGQISSPSASTCIDRSQRRPSGRDLTVGIVDKSRKDSIGSIARYSYPRTAGKYAEREPATRGHPVYMSDTTTTTYYIHSTVLGGKTIAELNANGGKTKGYVYSGGGRIVHQLTEGELETLTQGHESRYRAYAGSLLSAGLAFSIPLISDSHRYVVIALAASCLGAGLAFSLSWLRHRKTPSETITRIRTRLEKSMR